MSETPLDVDAYLRRIGFAGAAPPTIDTLARLIDLHAAAIPFENIEVLAGRVPRLDIASLQHKLVGQRRGGYCFEQNGFFLAALRTLGFAVVGLEARVRAGVPDDVTTGRTHMAIRVTLGGEHHLADVGFGRFSPTRPLRLEATDVQRDPFAAYRLRRADEDLVLECQTLDGWIDCYRIAAALPQPIDYEMGNWFVATWPNAFLRQNLLVARSAKRGRLTLLNDTLTLRPPALAPAEERTLRSRAEFADALADEFGLTIAAADLDAAIAVVEHQRSA